MLKTVTALAAAGSLAAFGALAGLAPHAGTAGAEAAPIQSSARKPRVAVSIPAATHGWTAGIGWWAERATKLYPEIEWTIVKAEGPEKQIADLEALLARGIDGVVILATESAPLTPVAREAKSRGVFIVNVDRGFVENPGEPQIADVFLEGDNAAFGRKSAEFMVKKLGGKGNIVILRGIPSTVDSDRYNAAMEVFKANPGIKVLDALPADWNRQKALTVMENLLTKHPRIDAVWAADDDMALGAIQAIKERGRERQMWVFPGAGMKEVVEMVMKKDPMVPANITYSPSMIAAGIHMAAGVLGNPNREQIMEFLPKHLMIDVELITPENAKNYYFPDSVY